MKKKEDSASTKMCDSKKCAGKGSFQGDTCPGSDSEEEVHHCVLCGWLTYTEKAARCDVCKDYYCNACFPHTFVDLDCDYIDGLEEYQGWEMICAPCFFQYKGLWCTDVACGCNQKYPDVQKQWTKTKEEIMEPFPELIPFEM